MAERPTDLLLRVDAVVYARTVLTFNRRRARLWFHGGFGIQRSVMKNIDDINPLVVRRLLVKEVV